MFFSKHTKRRRPGPLHHVSGLGLLIDQHLNSDDPQPNAAQPNTEHYSLKEEIEVQPEHPESIPTGLLSASSSGSSTESHLDFGATRIGNTFPKASPYQLHPSQQPKISKSKWLFGDNERSSELILSKRPSLGDSSFSFSVPSIKVSKSLSHCLISTSSTSSRDLDSIVSSWPTQLPSYHSVFSPTPSYSDSQKTEQQAFVVSGRVNSLWQSRIYPVLNTRYTWIGVILLWTFSLYGFSYPTRYHAAGLRHPSSKERLTSNRLQVLKHSHSRPTLTENLRSDVRYVIGGSSSHHSEGIAQESISLYKLIYLSTLLNRVSIIKSSMASKGQTFPQLIPIREIYDLNSLRWSLLGDTSFLEISSVKLPYQSQFTIFKGDRSHQSDRSGFSHSGKSETIPCWQIGELEPSTDSKLDNHLNHYGIYLNLKNLNDPKLERSTKADALYESVVTLDWKRSQGLQDFSFEPSGRHRSRSAKLERRYSHKQGTSNREDQMKSTEAENLERLDLLPKPIDSEANSLFCVDHTLNLQHAQFGASVPRLKPSLLLNTLPGEDEAWKTVGQHMRFQPSLIQKADATLRRLLGLYTPLGRISNRPQFNAVSVVKGVIPDRYMISIEVVNTLRHLQPQSNSNPSKLRTIAFIQDSSVSKSVEFGLARLGWIVVSPNDLSRQWEKANKARNQIDRAQEIPELMMEVMMSRASGFVGISEDYSSHLAALRCKYWNQAPSIMA